MIRLAPRALLAAALLLAAAGALARDGIVIDRSNGLPVANATVLADDEVVHTDAAGRFSVREGRRLRARAIGYRPHEPALSPGSPLRIELEPVRPKALYLSVYGIGDARLRDDALGLADRTEIDALVIDIKGDRGLVPHASQAVAAAGLAPQTAITVADMPRLVRDLHARGLYLIARLVVFKDDPLARSNPQWAVRDAHGEVWRDRENLAWIDPFRRQAWERTLALAEEAARFGFDEVQFDYLRFPDATGLRFSEVDTQASRVATVGAFLDAARARLAPHNVFISADIFGYVAWNTDDTRIGQHLESLIDKVDYLSPMLYPSGFTFGIPGHRDPVAAPFEIVEKTLRSALQRTTQSGLRFRPWLQAFADYAFDRRAFGAREIRAQIEAAERLGTDGWMLWNPHNRYSDAGLEPASKPGTR